jgi:head-tail adaptor
MPGAGRLDRRVQVLRAALTDNGFEEVETFEPHGSPIWAERADLSDAERARAGEVSAVLMTRFVVRSSAFTRGLTPRDRLLSEGTTFEITGIKQRAQRRHYLEISASSRPDTDGDA